MSQTAGFLPLKCHSSVTFQKLIYGGRRGFAAAIPLLKTWGQDLKDPNPGFISSILQQNRFTFSTYPAYILFVPALREVLPQNQEVSQFRPAGVCFLAHTKF